PRRRPRRSRSAARAEPAAESGLDRLRQASRLGLARAERLAARDYRLSAGAHIPCVLETALDSTTPGYVTCLAPSDVYSDTGALVVLDKGTRVLGEYRTDLRPGQGRLFILWSRAVTPGGVAIQLASPASDALGRAGVSGDLDSHFWDRFGGAVMMSLVDDAGAQIQTELGAQQGLRLPAPASALALQSGLTVAPTLRKDAGALVSIFVAQDLDFSGVYGLAPRAP
ncbi:TrbI/VirB10 family protein, partial [Phenylobacterium aquaticum]|uniref:TrbI/VirB10 family protein n=1 Tax=Phenylobacterium aquaticum TaxID=1763816 RepID=UPI002351AFE4